jgi:ribosomal protein S18 acetylase RimI-like enzyme
VSTADLDEQVLPLDLVGSALRGPHRHLALGEHGPALRYPPDVAAFGSLGSSPGPEAWTALTALRGDTVALVTDGPIETPTPGWAKARELPVLMLAGADIDVSERAPQLIDLTATDVPEMLDLVARTTPGPFLTRTIELGGYVGIRRDGALVAMAGRRLHPRGWIEVSAVCTDPAHRGAGLARQVINAVIAGIHVEGARPFLHVLPSNPAVKLYESIGFAVMRESVITGLQRVV